MIRLGKRLGKDYHVKKTDMQKTLHIHMLAANTWKMVF